MSITKIIISDDGRLNVNFDNQNCLTCQVQDYIDGNVKSLVTVEENVIIRKAIARLWPVRFGS